MIDVDATTRELREQLLRFPADRYPFQHATAQFHLGVALLDAGRVDAAITVLRTAADLFDPRERAVEHAKATNMLGVALRTAALPRQAAEAFERASTIFVEHETRLEEAAARYNLGLARRELGDDDDVVCFAAALELFEAAGAGIQAAAAARELGASLLARGRSEDAMAQLTHAVDLARRSGDQMALGAAANVLGLAQLATDLDAAVESFRTAVVANPRTVRPEAYAMAKANLALAHERAGAWARARLSARHAAGTPASPEAVTAQAAGILQRRSGDTAADASADLFAVLDEEPGDEWAPLLREELARWLDAEPSRRTAELGGWIDGVVARPGVGPELAQAWVGQLLEAPPEALESVVRSLLEALGERTAETQDRFRSQMARAMIRFHIPQWTRLRETLNRIAAELGQQPSWE